MRDILVVAFFLFVIYHSFKRPYVGVCAWVWISLTAPTEWAFGFSTNLRMNLTIVAVTFLSYIIAFKDKKFNIGGSGVLVLLFLLQCLISTSVSNTVDSTKTFGYFVAHFKVAALFFFIILIIRTKTNIIAIVWCFILSVSSYAAMEATKFILSFGGHEIIGKAGILADRNDLAVAINMCIPLIFFLIYVTEHKKVRLGLFILALLNVIAIVGTYSRGGFIGLCIIACAAWLGSRHKILLAMLLVLAAPVAYQYTPESWRERQSTVSTASTEDGSFIGRLWAWKISALIASNDPLTGGGYRAVTDPVLWGYYAPFTPMFGPIETPPIPPELTPKAAHNIYFQVLGDHGFTGLLLFILILTKSFVDNWRNIGKARKLGELWLAKLCSALNIGIIGYGITGLNVSLAYFDLSYAFFALIVVINNYLKNRINAHG